MTVGRSRSKALTLMPVVSMLLIWLRAPETPVLIFVFRSSLSRPSIPMLSKASMEPAVIWVTMAMRSLES